MKEDMQKKLIDYAKGGTGKPFGDVSESASNELLCCPFCGAACAEKKETTNPFTGLTKVMGYRFDHDENCYLARPKDQWILETQIEKWNTRYQQSGTA